jgi:23S rRNA (cytidine1920-2'-O)/16S rRNA (cytidine1409-2'-O)-methyltransferase
MRLDQYLVENGLSPTRSQAREAIVRGAVRVNGMVATRAGHRVTPGARVETEADRFVGRGARKLLAALDHFGIDPAGRTALDVGASTGGFTEVLLRRGARLVMALDVGRGQLAPQLAADPRILVMDGMNVRHLDPAGLPHVPDLVVADVSFISLTLALPPALAAASSKAEFVALVKPQFEVGRGHVGKGGIVRDEAAARAAVERVRRTVTQDGFDCEAAIPAPIAGGDGNREWLIAGRRR